MSLPDLAAAEVRLMLLEDLPPWIANRVKPYELALLARCFIRGWTAHARKVVLEERARTETEALTILEGHNE